MNWFVCSYVIISAYPLCDAVHCRLWLILSKMFWIYYRLIQSMVSHSGFCFFSFCCLCSEKKMERVRLHMKLQRAAFSTIIWFGDLNSVSLRQLLLYGLDLPDTQAEIVRTEKVRESSVSAVSAVTFLCFIYRKKITDPFLFLNVCIPLYHCLLCI